MSLQFISDSKGETTGVYIPIWEWNELKVKFKELEQAEVDMPDWHKNIVRKRVTKYGKNPAQGLDFDTAIDEIEREL